MGKRLEQYYLCIVIALCAFGTVMVFSASGVSASLDADYDNLFFLKRQFLFLSIGIVAMLGLARMDYHLLHKYWKPMVAVTIGLLLLVMVAGSSVNNAQRWLRFGPINFQPSEIAKFAAIIAAAALCVSQPESIRTFRHGFLKACLLVAPMAGLVLIQPDLGTALFIAAIFFVVMLAGGMNPKHVGMTAAAVLPVVVIAMFFSFGHVKDRILVFLDPEADITGKGHQIYQSLIAVGSGGFFGKGLGESTQKLYFLPEHHTDFVFAIVVEELGFFGAATLIVLFGLLLYIGYRISKHAPDRFGALLTMGFTVGIVAQALVNFAVVTASVPTKGISLPFISFGGTGLVVALAGSGIVLNVARQALERKQVSEQWQKEAATPFAPEVFAAQVPPLPLSPVPPQPLPQIPAPVPSLMSAPPLDRPTPPQAPIKAYATVRLMPMPQAADVAGQENIAITDEVRTGEAIADESSAPPKDQAA